MLVHQKPYVTTTFDTSVPCITQVWNGYANSTEFREATLRVLGFVQVCKLEYPHIQFLVDARKLGPLCREDMEWAAQVADPQLYAAGMRKIAFIVPSSALGRTSLKTYQHSAEKVFESPIESRQFADPAEALLWLKNKK